MHTWVRGRVPGRQPIRPPPSAGKGLAAWRSRSDVAKEAQARGVVRGQKEAEGGGVRTSRHKPPQSLLPEIMPASTRGSKEESWIRLPPGQPNSARRCLTSLPGQSFTHAIAQRRARLPGQIELALKNAREPLTVRAKAKVLRAPRLPCGPNSAGALRSSGAPAQPSLTLTPSRRAPVQVVPASRASFRSPCVSGLLRDDVPTHDVVGGRCSRFGACLGRQGCGDSLDIPTTSRRLSCSVPSQHDRALVGDL